MRYLIVLALIFSVITTSFAAGGGNSVPTIIQLRRDTPTNWNYYNTILNSGEVGCELNGNPLRCTAFKIGDGVTAWGTLPYFATGTGGGGGTPTTQQINYIAGSHMHITGALTSDTPPQVNLTFSTYSTSGGSGTGTGTGSTTIIRAPLPTGGDDAPNWQAAINEAAAIGGVAYFQIGNYLLNSTVTLPATPFTVEGEAFSQYANSGVYVKANNNMAAMFQYSDPGTSRGGRFKNLYLDGNAKAQYGILGGDGAGTFSTQAYTRFNDVLITGTTVAACAVGGWNNEFDGFYTGTTNLGDGLVLTGTNNNAVSIMNSDLNATGGWGLVDYGGTNLFIPGSTSIQLNKKGGIHFVGNRKGATVKAYFELNAQTGYTMATPSRTIKTDVLLNSTTQGNETTATSSSINYDINLEGATFIDNYASNPVFLVGITKGLRFTGNISNFSFSKPAIGFEMNGNYFSTASLTYENNSYFAKPIDMQLATGQSAALVAGSSNQINIPLMRNWRIEDSSALTTASAPFYGSVITRNLFPTSVTGMVGTGIIVSNPGTLGRAAKTMRQTPNIEAFEITCGNNSLTDVFGASYQSSDYAQLSGKPMYFAADVIGEDGTTTQAGLYFQVTWNNWQASSKVIVGQRAVNGGNVYEVTTAGTTASSGGPSGTGTGITDGGAVWKYVATNATSSGVDSVGGTLSTTAWQERELHFNWPNPGATVIVGVRISGTGSGGKRVVFTRPVLTQVGVPFSTFWTTGSNATDWKASATPTNGAWDVGDHIAQSTTATGQPKGWFVTTAGVANSGSTRADGTVYNMNTLVKWPTSTTVWECIVNGVSGTGAPDITGATVGTTVTDGGVTWIMRGTTGAVFTSEGNL